MGRPLFAQSELHRASHLTESSDLPFEQAAFIPGDRDVAIVIPARFQSRRLPGKPLAAIAGVSLLERVWRIAQAVERVSSVTIATDDARSRTPPASARRR